MDPSYDGISVVLLKIIKDLVKPILINTRSSANILYFRTF